MSAIRQRTTPLWLGTRAPSPAHTIKIDDELYSRASGKVANLEAEVNQRVNDYLEGINGDDDGILAARTRMADLFNATSNFGVGVRLSREEMYEPRSIR